jgi:formylglycine-generating enzyme required for sulfatase activity/GTPase SAR1 family protein
MSTQRISILGTESSGKTVLLGALTHALSSTANYPHITAENVLTKRYTAGIMDALETGKWPASTATGVRQNLRWLWHDRDHDTHDLHTFDCAGQDFRAIFESDTTDADTAGGLNAQQLALREAFFSSNLVLLLFNFQDALDIYKKPGKNQARIEVEYAPAAAIRRLHAAGITVYIVFTQADRYRARIATDWNGDYSDALQTVLPQLFLAAQETGTPFLVVNAVETEERDGTMLPKKTAHTSEGVSEIVQNVENFFIVEKRREKERKQMEEYAAKEAAEKTAKREAEERQQREKEEFLQKKAELLLRKKKEAKGNKSCLGCLIIFVVAGIIGGIVERVKKIENTENARIAAEADVKRKEAETQKLAEEKARIEAKALAEALAEVEARKLAQAQAKRQAEEAQRLAKEQTLAKARTGVAETLNTALQTKKSFIIESLNLEMRPIPAGTFTMGSSKDDLGRSPFDVQRRVTLSRPFFIGATEVTQGQWKAIMGTNPSHFQNAGDNAPVERVTWFEAVEFCKKITKREHSAGRLPDGFIYTLPTEAQWEYACRAGTTTQFNTGAELTSKLANFQDEPSRGGSENGVYRKTTTPVKSFAPNAWGLYDMHGNVAEWCLDVYVLPSAEALTDPVGVGTPDARILRGGAWDSIAMRCRSAAYQDFVASFPNKSVGFRLALVFVAR